MATCPKCSSHYSDDVQTCPTDGETLLPDEACANFDQDLDTGTVVGEYQIEAKIGEGGFGKVYKAVHPVIGKRAAIKVLNREFSSNPAVVSRFVSEARAVNQIRQRNIIDIFSFGSLAEAVCKYLVMELLDGADARRLSREEQGRIPPEQAICRSCISIAQSALDAAHARRDRAPRSQTGERLPVLRRRRRLSTPSLLDFGIAKLMGDSNGESQDAHRRGDGHPTLHVA